MRGVNMADKIRNDAYVLVANSETLYNFARTHDLFIFPYDLKRAADIALYENTMTKNPFERYIIFAVCDMNEHEAGENSTTLYALSNVERAGDCRTCSSETYEGAIFQWNMLMKKTAKTLLKPPLQRFWDTEHFYIKIKFVLYGFVGFLFLLNNRNYHFFLEHNIVILTLFIIVCSNIKNIFLKSYWEEVPEGFLFSWANADISKFDEEFFKDAMSAKEALKKLYENPVPIYTLWKRGKLKNQIREREKAEEEAKNKETPEKEVDNTYELYCEEIKSSLSLQINEIRDLKTKIYDMAVRYDIDNILKILSEILQTISAEENSPKIISARRVVSYWNDELISFLKSYVELLNNSSDEAAKSKNNIENIIKDLYPVYKKELGHITKADTLEIDAAVKVMRDEINQALKN